MRNVGLVFGMLALAQIQIPWYLQILRKQIGPPWASTPEHIAGFVINDLPFQIVRCRSRGSYPPLWHVHHQVTHRVRFESLSIRPWNRCEIFGAVGFLGSGRSGAGPYAARCANLKHDSGRIFNRPGVVAVRFGIEAAPRQFRPHGLQLKVFDRKREVINVARAQLRGPVGARSRAGRPLRWPVERAKINCIWRIAAFEQDIALAVVVLPLCRRCLRKSRGPLRIQ